MPVSTLELAFSVDLSKIQISGKEFVYYLSFRGIGIKMTHPLYEAPSLDETLPDVVFAQNLPSIVCCLVLDPQPGEIVIDMCASPGGLQAFWFYLVLLFRM